MLETNQTNNRLLSFVAEYAQLTASGEELAAYQALLDSFVTPVRTSPNTGNAVIEPMTTFHVSTAAVSPTTSASVPLATSEEAPSSAPDDVIYLSVSEAQALFQAKSSPLWS